MLAGLQAKGILANNVEGEGLFSLSWLTYVSTCATTLIIILVTYCTILELCWSCLIWSNQTLDLVTAAWLFLYKCISTRTMLGGGIGPWSNFLRNNVCPSPLKQFLGTPMISQVDISLHLDRWVFDQAPPGGGWSLLRVSGVGVSAFNFGCRISTDSASAFVVCICSS